MAVRAALEDRLSDPERLTLAAILYLNARAGHSYGDLYRLDVYTALCLFALEREFGKPMAPGGGGVVVSAPRPAPRKKTHRRL